MIIYNLDPLDNISYISDIKVFPSWNSTIKVALETKLDGNPTYFVEG